MSRISPRSRCFAAPQASSWLLLGASLLSLSPSFAFAAEGDSGAAAARRAALLQERARIDAELRRLDALPPETATETDPAGASAAPRDGLETIVVTAHPQAPAAQTATRVDRAQFAYQPGTSIAEALSLSPGVSFVQGNGPRDVAVSVRGSSNRQTYGVRNIKVFEDGFDVTQPDGLSRTDLTDPHAYGSIDVLRGPSSAWFGNYASGGAIDFRLRDGADIRGIESGLDAGSYGYLNAYALAGDAGARYDYTAFISNARGASHTAHSNYITTTANIIAGIQASARDRLTFKLIDNELDADLPLRLSLAQFRENPYQHGCDASGANGCATTSLLDNGYNADDGRTALTPAQAGLGRHDRRTILGARWEHVFDAVTRMQTQFVFDNRDIKQPTGSASYDGTYPSFNLRGDLFHDGTLFGLAARSAAGVFYNDEEQNSDVFNVTPEGHAARGAVTQHMTGRHLNGGLRLREELQLAPQWTGVLGLGGEYTRLSGQSTAYAYPSAATPSLARVAARREFFDVAPEAALRYAPDDNWLLHLRVAGGYGTPQIGNLFVDADGNAGNNTGLDPQRNYGVDLGADWHLDDTLRVELTGFYEWFRDELVSQSPGVGRQNYTFNAPRSEHRGVELGVDWRPLPQALPGARISLAYTCDDQIYRRYDERISNSSDSQVFDRGGQKIPGVQPQTVNARLAYDQPSGALQGLGAYVELNAREGFWLDNANLIQAPGYSLVNFNLHYDPPAPLRVSFYLAVQNLLDRTYVGSASNLGDRLDSTRASLASSGGAIYAGNPRLYYGGVRLRF
ncbi:TonB-dependent receptor family protein [Solimonas terrae]|uniref:TonB-dependent receptor n=1 Tax=Solimonas terrae TaxID=1396819 RepID=A0A6M2BSF0_9GAMM|nr:TonB-dependent receptor [Solimonas terrae]NGY05552.1 TonB-dependent receptor [Solimonas terrae]